MAQLVCNRKLRVRYREKHLDVTFIETHETKRYKVTAAKADGSCFWRSLIILIDQRNSNGDRGWSKYTSDKQIDDWLIKTFKEGFFSKLVESLESEYVKDGTSVFFKDASILIGIVDNYEFLTRAELVKEIIKKLNPILNGSVTEWVDYTDALLPMLSRYLQKKIIIYNQRGKIFQCYDNTQKKEYIFLHYTGVHYEPFVTKNESTDRLSKSALAAIQRQRAVNPAVSKLRQVQYKRPPNLGKYRLTILCADEQNPNKWQQYINKNVVDSENINRITEKVGNASLIHKQNGGPNIIFIEEHCPMMVDVEEVIESLRPETLFVVKKSKIRAYEDMVDYKLIDHMQWASPELIKSILTLKAQDEWTVYIKPKIKKSPQRESVASAPAKSRQVKYTPNYGLTILCADGDKPNKWQEYIEKNVVDSKNINRITEKVDNASLIGKQNGGPNHIFIEENCPVFAATMVDVDNVIKSLQPGTLFVVKQKKVKAYKDRRNFILTNYMEKASQELIKSILTPKAQGEWTVYIKKAPQVGSASEPASSDDNFIQIDDILYYYDKDNNLVPVYSTTSLVRHKNTQRHH